jgi:hypothetical protein
MAAKLVGQTGNEVTFAGSDGITAATAIGFFLETVTGNRAAQVATRGFVPAIAGAAIKAGDSLMVGDVIGRVYPLNTALGNIVQVAIAMQSANAQDDVLVVMPTPGCRR